MAQHGIWGKGADKYLAPSEETWMSAKPFHRQIEWEIYGKRYYRKLAKLLQVPEELLRANTVHITVNARRNVSSGPFQDKRRVPKEWRSVDGCPCGSAFIHTHNGQPCCGGAMCCSTANE